MTSGAAEHLAGVGEAGTERDREHDLAGADLARGAHPVQGYRNGRRRGVAGGDDVPAHLEVVPAPSFTIFFAMASTMRRLAWWVTSTSTSLSSIPAAAAARMATGAMAVVAHRKTVCPSWMKWPLRPSTRMVRVWSSSQPQTTGPMPGSSAADTTTAPAPSAKMIAVARSSDLVQSVS